ncbi:MAG TPA: DUF2975 domain-containing protein [Allosphingosinicella sp.]|nr:DUF2975 domain-containing protein [Allosphingosinicella sp.]
MSHPYSAALPIAWVGLRILIVLNWLFAVAVLVLLFVMPHEHWLMISLKLTPSPEATRIVWGMRGIAVIGLFTIPLYHLILTRLLAMVGTVREGDPFVLANAARLQTIAWILIVLQVLGLVIAIIVRMISTPAHPINISAGPSIAGLLAILLVFVLARVFAEGARMREDLEGTV